MNTASQNPAGGLPPESPPAATPQQAAEVFAAYGQVLPVPVGTTHADPWQGSDVPYVLRSPFPEPTMPQCCTCQAPARAGESALRPDPAGRRYPSGAQVLYCLPHLPQTAPVRAAAGVIAAAMANGAATPQELAQAEADVGLLFDPERAADIAAASAEQAHAEDEAELAERGRELARMAGAQRRADAVGRLIEGRPGFHLLPVAEIAAAVEYGKTPHDGSPPMTLTWTGRAQVPDARSPRKQVVVECTSSYGGRTNLVLTDEERGALAGLLTTETRDPNAKCPTYACGTDQDLDPVARHLVGWSRLEIASLCDGPRWYCSDMCVVDALARAGRELALVDQADGLDARYGVGASDEYALQVAQAHAADVEDERGDVDEAAGGAV